MAKSMWDASTPPAVLPPGFDAAAGYIGGDTPHVWTGAEWMRLGSLPKLPIWVQSGPQAVHAEAEAGAALRQLYRIGARPGLHRSPGPGDRGLGRVRQHVPFSAGVLRLPRLGVRLPVHRVRQPARRRLLGG